MKRKLNKQLFNKVFILYIIIQPMIDIFTAFFLLKLDTTITPGFVIRNVVFGLLILYMFFEEKIHVKYLILVATYYLFHFLTNYFSKEVFEVFQEITYFSKLIFLFVSYFMLRHLLQNANESDLRDKIIQGMWIAMSLISIIIIVAALTNTGINAYESEKLGQTGWFFSGNQVSASMAILFPISLLYTIQKGKIAYYILIICNMIAMFMSGTKTSFIGMALGLAAAIFILLIHVVRLKERAMGNNLIIITLLALCVIIYTPYSPMVTNMKIHESWQSQVEIDPLLNGREIKSEVVKQNYLEGSTIRKLLGVGYGGDYDKDSIIIIERDFHEIYYYYGIVGFLILLYYPIVVYLKIIVSYMRGLMKPQISSTMLLVSITSAYGCAFIAGHVLFSPAVSIFLVCSMCLAQEAT